MGEIFKRTKLMLFIAVAAVLAAGTGLGYYLFTSESFSSPDTESLAVKISAACRYGGAGKSGEECYAKELEKVAYGHGAQYAFKVLEEIQKIDTSARGCHFIAHGIGYGVYKRNPGNWQNDLATLSPICSYGAPMGIIEMYTATLSSGTITKEFVPTICGPNPHLGCSHIVGHVLLADSTVKGDIPKALDLCDGIGDSENRFQCLSGVFMEHQTAFNLIEHGYAPQSYLNWPARLPDLEKMCHSYSGERGKACWTEIVHASAVAFHNNYQEVFDFCGRANDPSASKECIYHAVGVMAGAKNFNIMQLKDMCSAKVAKDPNFEDNCHNALIASILSSIPQELPNVVGFCASVREQLRAGCFGYIGAIAQDETLFKKGDLDQACKKAPSEYQSYCLSGSENLLRFRND